MLQRNPSESLLAISGVNSNSIFIIDLQGQITHQFQNELDKEVTWMFASVWVDNSLLAAGYADGRVQFFKLGTTGPLKELKPFHGNE